MSNTALNRTTAVLLTNKSGGALTFGDVVILDNTNANGFTTTTTAGLSTRGIGVILERNGIANNAQGMVAVGGYCPQVNLNTAATVGQLIKTHTVAGQATPHSSPKIEGDFGVALSASATPAALLFGVALGPQGSTVAGGSDKQIQYNNATAFGGISNGTAGQIMISAGAGSAPAFGWTVQDNSIMNGRLTTESGVPVSTSDRASQGTIYFTPYQGNRVTLYDGTQWRLTTFSELSLALSGLTSGKNYDVFLDWNSGTPQLVLSAAWTNDTTRADAIALQDGVYVKSGTTTYRLIGTIRTTSTTTTEDSTSHRFVANLYNRKRRELYVTESTDSWAYTTASWRQARASATNQVDFVVCIGDEPFHAQVSCGFYSASNVNWAVGLGVNSTSANSARTFGVNTFNFYNVARAEHEAYPAAGYTYIAWLEYGGTGGTFYGDAGTPAVLQYGMTAIIIN